MSTEGTRAGSSRKRIGPYRLLKRLGQGAGGSVFLADHKDLGTRFAIKVMATESERLLVEPGRAETAARLARFVREGRTLAHLSKPGHPGIVRVYDCRRNQARTRAYLVMEYVDGVSLRAWLSQRAAAAGQPNPPPVPINVAVGIGLQIADALSFVHERGVIHRDVKPENVLIRAQSAEDAAEYPTGTVTLVDFGIAKIAPSLADIRSDTNAEKSLTTLSTKDGALLGTVGYMAPEQCRGLQATDRADVYALGVILFELLAGEPPFKGQSAVELLIQHVQHDPPSLVAFAAQRGVTVPRWLSELISSMLDKDPGQRPSMASVAGTLRSPPAGDACPLPGLTPLSSANAELLIGRSQEAALVVGWLQRTVSTAAGTCADASPSGRAQWIVLEGSAGVGKTSLVQAGIIPRLDECSGTSCWTILKLAPSAEALAQWHSGYQGGSTKPVLLWVDQVEQMLASVDAEAARWASVLAQILSKPWPVAVLTVVRRDALARLMGLQGLRQFEQSVCAVPQLGRAMLSEAIAAISRRGRVRLEAGLCDRIVEDSAATSVPLGFIHLFFQLLWQHRGGGLLSLSDYEQIAGRAGMVRFLSEAIERDLERLAPVELACARQMVLALVWPGRGLPDTRRARSRQDLLRAAGSTPDADAALRHLSGEGATALEGPPLLVAASDAGETALTLVHDAVLSEVPLLAGWIAADRPDLEFLAHIEELAADWKRAGTSPGDLPRGTLLEHYAYQKEKLAQRGTLLAQHFISAALAAERRQRMKRRWLRIASVVAGLAILTSAGLAWLERTRALTSARYAAAARDRASEHLRQVLGSVEQIATDTDWDLAVLPDPSGTLFAARRGLLESAEARLRVLSEEDLARSEVRIARIRVRQRLADLAFWHISLKAAEAWLSAAYPDIIAGLRGSQQRGELRMLEALYWSKKGKIALARGQRDVAVRAFGQSLDLLNRLRSEQKGVPTVDMEGLLLSLATSSQELGLAHVDAAAPAAERAAGIKLLEQSVALFAQAGSTPYSQGLAADAKLHLAEVAIRDGQLADAEARLNDAQERYRTLLQSAPTHMGWRTSYLRSQYIDARWMRAQGRTDAAAAALEKAAEGGRLLLLAQPAEHRHIGQVLVVAAALVELSDYPDLTQQQEKTQDELCRILVLLAGRDPEHERLISVRIHLCLEKSK